MDNHYCIWQFNFREFSLTDDMYAQACAAGDASPPLAFPPPPHQPRAAVLPVKTRWAAAARAQDSIELLKHSGIDFKAHRDRGVDVLRFGELLMVRFSLKKPVFVSRQDTVPRGEGVGTGGEDKIVVRRGRR